MLNKNKIINDPIYGFITIPNELIFDLIEHAYFQRLRRICQMGMSYTVYPGAHHTRFHHALGCMHLMKKAIDVLRFKGTNISEQEETALLVAILLHDMGHGPFSHAMEHSIVENFSHESISLLFMEQLNIVFEGKLTLAIQVFRGNYHRKFMYQLISSQLDMDRLDYLKRDSFYSGVEEGKINSDRLIQMMNVVDDQLVIEEKGIYSVEKFLMARRLMYWQVYFHKTSLVAELLLTKVLKRAKELTQKNIDLPCSAALSYFLKNQISINDFDQNVLDKYAQLDDFDIIAALKNWQYESDFVLQKLSKMILNRELLGIKLQYEPFSKSDFNEAINDLCNTHNLTKTEANYFVIEGKITNQTYKKNTEPIMIYYKDKTIKDISIASHQLNSKTLSKPVIKYYLCFPKKILL